MSKIGFSVTVALVFAIGVLFMPVREAHAVAAVEINVAGQALGETTLQLTDMQGNTVKEDERSDRAAGYWYWSNARPGTYRLQVMRNGVAVGAPRTVQITDNTTNRFRADAQSGQVATVSPGMTPDTQKRFSVGVLGGGKFTPWDGNISSEDGNFSHEGGLDRSLGVLGLEGRWHMSPTQQRMQALGKGLFLTGTVLYYLNGGRDRFLGDEHPTQGDDVGAGVDERWSAMLGIGKQFNVYQAVGVALMVGAHMTRLDVAALADESGGGGENFRFEDSKTVFGPFIGGEIFTALGAIAAFPALQLVLQGRMMWMPDVDVSGRSDNTNWEYRAEAEGGPQFSVTAGVRVPF